MISLWNGKKNHDNDYYIKCFKEQVLDKLNLLDVMGDLINMTMEVKNEPKDIALIYYEKPSDFCHRHLVSDWLNKNGISCREYVNESGEIV